MRGRVPTDKEIIVWSNGCYVYASAGDGPDDFIVNCESPVRGNGDTRRDEVTMRQATMRALAEIRRRERSKYRPSGRRVKVRRVEAGA
jgi:hypothetical protein